MSTNYNNYGKYVSKIKRLNIPMPGFSQKGDSAENGKYLIGRRIIIERLKSKLDRNTKNGGTYLVTGYRGMGKTSFVDRVLYEFVTRPSKFIVTFSWFLIICVFLLSLYFSHDIDSKVVNEKNCCYLIFLFIVVLVIAFVFWNNTFVARGRKYCFIRLVKKKYKEGNSCTNKEHKKKLKQITPKEWDRIGYLLNYKKDTKSYRNIKIKINLGQEILDEKSVLSVLAYDLYKQYKKYICSPISNCVRIILFAIVFGCVCGLKKDLINRAMAENLVALKIEELVNVWPIIIYFIVLFVLFFLSQICITLRLRWLSKWIDASIEQQSSVKYDKKNNIFGDLGASFGSSYKYNRADTRQIETRLISVLDDIGKTWLNPYFFFVFDELDKLESGANNNDSQSSTDYSNERYLPSGGASRQRMNNVMHLLANMKFFTSSAKAQFIFIAGREMYDAYLADMTDRESTISSIFDDVTYVDSFCKNERSERDVLYNTEAFLVRYLLPKGYIREKIVEEYIKLKIKDESFVNLDINLKLYYEYLQNKCLNINKSTTDKNYVAKEGIDNIMVFLYRFSAYLYHISNGSPKKMQIELERFVRPILDKKDFIINENEMRHMFDGSDLDIRIPENSSYLISFSEEQQRLIGFIHYISFPVNQIIANADEFGDKLLVSTSFLINHIYKFHNGGFSWRNIEQTPELMEVYKIPGFRDFIKAILNYLLQTHIIKIPCGLYQFKFRKHISEEISLASKMYEQVSAIFNFTLGESLSIKNHYLNLLKYYQESYSKEKIKNTIGLYNIHLVLADLYMADEEFNNAIIEYQTSVNILVDNAGVKENGGGYMFSNGSNLLAYVRTMLKLGIAYEKRGTIESAYNTYNEIIHEILCFRNIRDDNRLVYFVDKENCSVIHKFREKTEEEDNQKDEWKNCHDLISFLANLNSIEDHTIVQRLSMLQDTRIIYQSLLARLFLIEKMELGGISRSNLDIIDGEFNFIHRTTKAEEKFLIATDFYRRVGDIMYYKNGLIGFGIDTESLNEDPGQSNFYRDCPSNEEPCSLRDKDSCKNCARIRDIELCMNSRYKSWKENSSLPCYACKYYNKSLHTIVKYLFDVDFSKVEDGEAKSRSIRLLELFYKDGRAKSMRKKLYDATW